MNLVYGLLVLAGAILASLAVVVLLFSRSKKMRYMDDIIELEICLKNFKVCICAYQSILDIFDRLYRNNQDEVRTEKNWNLFKERYSQFFEEPNKIEMELQKN
jgi:hypothetical protein